MPGFILHLTAARMFLDAFPMKDERDVDFFMTGAFLPDVSSDKFHSHFRDPALTDRMVEIPDLERFLASYKDKLDDPLIFGYYFHLYVDRRFFLEYLPKIVTYMDSTHTITPVKAEVTLARIQKSGKILPLSKFLSDEYYYGDYTRMNTYLIERYHLPSNYHIDFPDPKIPGVDYEGIPSFIEMMKGYLTVPLEDAFSLQVFDLEDILSFLQTISTENSLFPDNLRQCKFCPDSLQSQFHCRQRR